MAHLPAAASRETGQKDPHANGGSLGRAATREREIIRAALAVNEAPDVDAAFGVLAETARSLLETDRVSVVVWGESMSHGAIRAVAGAGDTQAGGVVEAADNEAHRAATTGRPVSGPPGPVGGVPTDTTGAVHELHRLAVPLLVEGLPAVTFQAGWREARPQSFVDEAIATLETLGALTSIAYRAEEERARARERARDATEEHNREFLTEQFLLQLFEALPTAIVVSDPSTYEVLSVNKAFLELLGYEQDEVVGGRPPHPWLGEAAPGFATQDGLPEDGHARFESLCRHRGGGLIPVEVVGLRIRGADGGAVAVVWLVTDLSERRLFEQRLQQSGKLAAIGELAAGVAHEINNPLFAILGLVEFLLKEIEPGTKAYSRLELIHQTGLEIKEIVRALLDFARESPEEHAVVALHEVASETVDLVRRTNAAKGVELVEDYEGEPGFVEASPNQLKQIFLNLITNARQAIPEGGTVTISVRRHGREAVAEVRDDGPGIPDDVKERIFEPFFTTKRRAGGSGLGLAVSHGIASAHGGDLAVESIAGEGATFTLRLPLREGGPA